MDNIIFFCTGAILCGLILLLRSYNPAQLAWVSANIGALIVAIIAKLGA